MNGVLILTLSLALLFVAAALTAFRWAVRTGQLDDLDTPPHRALTGDEVGARRD